MLLHKDEGHGPRSMIDHEDSAVLINAVLKEPFPPISLPKQEYMENARKIWEEMGLPRQSHLFPDLACIFHVLLLGQRDRRKGFLEDGVDQNRRILVVDHAARTVSLVLVQQHLSRRQR